MEVSERTTRAWQTGNVSPAFSIDVESFRRFFSKKIAKVESVQRRFTKRLPGLNNLSYPDRLKRVNLAYIVWNCGASIQTSSIVMKWCLG